MEHIVHAEEGDSASDVSSSAVVDRHHQIAVCIERLGDGATGCVREDQLLGRCTVIASVEIEHEVMAEMSGEIEGVVIRAARKEIVSANSARAQRLGVAPQDVVPVPAVEPVPAADRSVVHHPGVATERVVSTAAEQVVAAADRGTIHLARVAREAVAAASAPQPVVAAVGVSQHDPGVAADLIRLIAAEDQIVSSGAMDLDGIRIATGVVRTGPAGADMDDVVTAADEVARAPRR